MFCRYFLLGIFNKNIRSKIEKSYLKIIYMFSEFNFDYIPFIKVRFNANVESDEDFYDFINNWQKINDKKENYYFIFDTTQVGLINIKYAVLLTKFISKLKKEKKKYLLGSIIYVNNQYIRYLLKFIFMTQNPISNVYIINNLIQIEPICNAFLENKIYSHEDVTLVKSTFSK